MRVSVLLAIAKATPPETSAPMTTPTRPKMAWAIVPRIIALKSVRQARPRTRRSQLCATKVSDEARVVIYADRDIPTVFQLALVDPLHELGAHFRRELQGCFGDVDRPL